MFDSNRDGNQEIYKVRADGSGEPIRLTNDPAYDGNPMWSPDGRFIVFDSDREDGRFEVYVMHADGKGKPIRLTYFTDDTYYPDWWLLRK